MPDVEIYRVDTPKKKLVPMTDLESLIDLAPGHYVAKPPSTEGCWMDAISFTVVDASHARYWEGATVEEEPSA